MGTTRYQLSGGSVTVLAKSAIHDTRTVWSQLGGLSLRSPLYLGLNFFGSALLAALAIEGRDWGFLLLEGVWAVVALWGLARLTRGREDTPAAT